MAAVVRTTPMTTLFSTARSNTFTTAAYAIAWIMKNNNTIRSFELLHFRRRWNWPKLSVFFPLILCALNASAQSILLDNAIVHTVSGETYTNGGVLINGGKIELVLDGKHSESAIADKVIDLKGQHVYPGLIALDSALGLSEIESVRATKDTTEVGDYSPDVQSWIAINPDS